MEPVITTAIFAALANLSQDAIKDSYNALKSALKQKFGTDSDLAEAVEKLEKRPESEARQATLKEEVEMAAAHTDAEVLQLAQALLQQVEATGGPQTIHQTQTNSVSGVNVGGDFNFAPVQENQRG